MATDGPKPTTSHRRARLVSMNEMSQKMPVAEGFGVSSEPTEMERWMEKFELNCTRELEQQIRTESAANYKKTTAFGFLDLAPFIRNGMEAIYQDSFTQCFESKPRHIGSNAFYLAPLYYIGVLIRYFILFPIRVAIVLGGLLLFALMYLIAAPLSRQRKKRIHENAVHMLCHAMLWSWCAVITEHGVPPPREAGQIYVANHTSVIDVAFLIKRQKYSLTGQAHAGGIGFFQNYILGCLECLWFDRLASKDRHKVAEKIKEHCADINKPPLLVFPEGTCVNNEYVIMFKRGAFDLGKSIVPVAIKYNKLFVDGFWNSKQQSFPQHIFTLMTSWAVIADVYYLDPQYREPGESATAFASRVKDLIATTAGLTSVPWDGYLKYFKPKKEMLEERKRMYTKMLLRRFDIPVSDHSDRESDDPSAAAAAAAVFAAPAKTKSKRRRNRLSETKEDDGDDTDTGPKTRSQTQEEHEKTQ